MTVNGGQWKPGQSGNPKGRTPAQTSRAALREQISEALPAIIRKLLAQARKGDVQAARTLLERVLPPARTEAASVNLPEVAAAKTFTERAESLFRAAVSGEIAPDIAAQLLTGITQSARTAHMDEMERRLAALEAERNP